MDSVWCLMCFWVVGVRLSSWLKIWWYFGESLVFVWLIVFLWVSGCWWMIVEKWLWMVFSVLVLCVLSVVFCIV